MHLVVAVKLGYALESHYFGYLSVGVHVVKAIAMLFHGDEQLTVGKSSGAVEVFLVAGHCVGIGYDLVHASVFVSEHPFHLLVGQSRSDVDSPIAEFQE